MSDAIPLTRELLNLVEQLRRAGYNIGARQHIDAQHLLLHLALRGEYSKDPEKIRLLLAPLLCRTPHEQAEFARHFEPLAEYLAAVQPPIPPSKEDPPGKPEKSFFAGALLRNTGLGSVFLAIMGLIVWLYGWQQFAAIVLPIMLLAAGLSVVWFRRDRLDTFLSRRSSHKKQQRQQFSVAGVDEKTIFHSIGLASDAQRLRRHAECPSGKLDIRATLEKTIRANDWFTPVYRQRKWMPEYLALIDRATFSDHQSQFADALLEQLETEGVVLNRYYFDCDPRYCYPEAHQLKGYTLPELLERHPEQRLLLFSDGAGLFDSITGLPADWLEQLHVWGQPSLFTLAAPAHYWRIREQMLIERNFLLFSANEQGLAAFAGFLENPVLGQARDGGDIRNLPALLSRLPQRWLARTKPDDRILESLISQLQNHLGQTGFIWLAACAVYPELRWPLTLKLGWHLTDKDNTLIKSCLSRLAPLPWFRQGKIPDWMRLALLEELSEEQEQLVRGIMDEVLNFRGTDPATVFFLDVVSRENRQSSDNDAWDDHVFLGFMDNRLAFRLPKEWRKQLRQVREQPITRFFQKVEQRLRPLMERLRVYAHNKTKPAKKKEGDPLASNATSDISVPSLPQTQESFSSLLRKYMDENAVNPGDLAVRITKETGEETHRQTLNNWLNGTPSKDQHNKVRVCARIFNLTKKQTNEFLAAAGFNEPYVLTGSFAEAIFTDYIKMLFDKLSLLNPYPVMLLLTQADWGEPPCREALLARAKKIYSPENVLDIRPAYSMSADTNEYFLDLGKQCGMAGVNNDYDFERGLKRRVEESRRLFLLVSHFEQGVKSLNKHLAGILRAVSETSSGQFHIMLCGGEELSTLKYRSGSLSLLNFAEVEHWPELSPADAKAVADYYFEELKVNEATAARLLKISGGHPRLLKECLRIHRNFSGSRYLDDKKYSEALSKNEEVYQLFMPFAQRGAEIRQTMHTWLQKERLAEFAPDIKNDLLRELYWKNLLVRRDSASGETWLHWRCPALQMGGLKILGDDDNIKQLKG